MHKSTGTRIHEAAFVIGVIGIVVAGIWLLGKRADQKSITANSDERTIITEETRVYASFDADGDGLLDWEEVLWGTDLQNKDTDKDGTNDGEEIALRRNPKKAGPRDSLETPLIVVEQKEPPFVPLKTEARMPVIPAEAETQSPNIPKVQSEDPLYTFGNALGTIIQTGAVDSDAELAFWNSAAGNTKINEELIQGFTKLAQKYEELSANIAYIAPPLKATEVHNTLLRAYQNYAKAIQAIAETPLGSYMSSASITTYADTAIALGRAFVDVSDLFYREGVRFDRTLPGNIFMFPR